MNRMNRNNFIFSFRAVNHAALDVANEYWSDKLADNEMVYARETGGAEDGFTHIEDVSDSADGVMIRATAKDGDLLLVVPNFLFDSFLKRSIELV